MDNNNANSNENNIDATPPPPMPSGSTPPPPTGVDSPSSTPPPRPSGLDKSPPQNAPPMPTPEKERLLNPRVADEEAPVVSGEDATFKERALAYLIDWAVIMAIIIVAAIGSAIVGVVSDILGGLVYLTGCLISLAYFFARDCLPQLNGVSIGKKAMKIRAVTISGQPLTGNWMPGVMRNVILLIPFLGFVEIYLLYTRANKHPLQRLGDEWFETKVIKSA